MAIDWSKAPEGAEFYAGEHFCKLDDGLVMFFSPTYNGWRHSIHELDECKDFDDYCKRPQQWPETDERINNIGLNRTTEDMGHYDEQREQHEQAQPAAPQANKYDRTIIGKYGTGKCTVDVYRVLNAFPSGSPEIDHALKKLLAPGKRGVKSELQDLKEAIQSIEARISYLSELGEK
jgi:hypothetical protein